MNRGDRAESDHVKLNAVMTSPAEQEARESSGIRIGMKTVEKGS
jgi:hypothetical protein